MQETVERISLEYMLQAREDRVLIQKSILHSYGSTVLTFTMNIPGPVKNTEWIWESFELGKQELVEYMMQYEMKQIHVRNIPTGPEGYFIFQGKATPQEIKERLCEFEEKYPIGRWFDLDVKDTEEKTISREEIGFPPRKCYLCDENAKVCGRSRRHTVEELFYVTEKALKGFVESVESKQKESLYIIG